MDSYKLDPTDQSGPTQFLKNKIKQIIMDIDAL